MPSLIDDMCMSHTIHCTSGCHGVHSSSFCFYLLPMLRNRQGGGLVRKKRKIPF